MRRTIQILLACIVCIALHAQERELIWKMKQMPYPQEHQIAAMTDETSQKSFRADKNRVAYIEWFEAPAEDVRNGGCMILISGGSYQICCEV